MQKYYGKQRSKCRETCKDFARDEDSLEKDMCFHKCMHKTCFNEYYADILIQGPPKYTSVQTAQADKEQRKSKFKNCLEHTEAESKPPPKGKNYNELTFDCALRFCNHIDKSDKYIREICLHKCVNEKCFEMIYFDVEVS